MSPGQTGRTPGGVPPKFFMFIVFFSFPKERPPFLQCQIPRQVPRENSQFTKVFWRAGKVIFAFQHIVSLSLCTTRPTTIQQLSHKYDIPLLARPRRNCTRQSLASTLQQDLPKGPFRTNNRTALESIVFCYRRSFSISVLFSCPVLPRKTSISEPIP